MHVVSRTRFLTLVAPLTGLVAVLLAVMFLTGEAGGVSRILATGPTPAAVPNLTGVSCADVFIDLDNNGVADNPSVVTSMSMARTEPSQTQSGKYDVTLVTYLGKAGADGLIPAGPPGPSCASTDSGAAAESNEFGGATGVPYGNQYGVRPSAVATYVAGTGMGTLSFSTCGYAENQQAWVRIDTVTTITKTGKNAVNNGDGVLYLGTGAPTTGLVDTNGDGVNDATTDPSTCDTTNAFAYNYVTTSYARNPTTDHPGLSKNSGIALDPDGPNNPKVKGVDQDPDSADGLADDWDGDGCPDWDELDKGFRGGSTALPLTWPPVYTWSTHPVNGLDPFNPYDCDSNWTSTISLTTTIVHNTGAGAGTTAVGCTFVQIIGGTCTGGAGQYFRCLGSMTHTKSGTQQPLAFKLGCYSDSTVTVVNSSYPEAPYDGARPEGAGMPANSCSNGLDDDGDGKIDSADSKCHASVCGSPSPTYAPATMCGDGKAGASPPGCVGAGDGARCASNTRVPNCASLPCPVARYVYVGIDPDTYPVVSPASGNYYDTTDNTIHLGGCFAGFGGGTFGNVFGSSVIDAHTGAGSFSIYLFQADNCAGSPTGTPIVGQVEIVELRTEKNLPTDCDGGSSDCHKYDSDGDGCADARELGTGTNAQTTGAFRDPYNPYDFFNPVKTAPTGSQTIADILKVVQQYNKNQGNVAYTSTTDRSAVFGGQSWNLGPPDGNQGIIDVLAAVKQYNHNCPLVLP